MLIYIRVVRGNNGFILPYCQINRLWEEIILSAGETGRKNATYRHALLQITLFLAKGENAGPGSGPGSNFCFKRMLL